MLTPYGPGSTLFLEEKESGMPVRENIAKLVEEVLDGTEMRLKVDAYRLEESLEDGAVRIHCEVHNERSGEKQVIEGEGVGVVDAFFHGLVGLYSKQFPSLNSIRFADFSLEAYVDTGKQSARSDMAVEVTLRVVNSNDREFAFTHSSPSITRSALYVTLEAVEFFIDCERAFIALYRALEHAKEQNRPDSVALYTSKMATLVEATSYSEVIDQIRKSALDA